MMNRLLYGTAMLVLALALVAGWAVRPYMAGQPVLVYGDREIVKVFNWSFSPVNIIGYRASCSCVSESKLPVEVAAFSFVGIPFELPQGMRSASVELYVDAKAYPMLARIEAHE